MQLLRAGDCIAASEQFDLAIRAAPEDAFAHNAAGQFGRAIRLQTAMPAAYYNRGNVYLSTSRCHLAVDDFTWAIDEQPNNPDYFTRRGRA